MKPKRYFESSVPAAASALTQDANTASHIDETSTSLAATSASVDAPSAQTHKQRRTFPARKQTRHAADAYPGSAPIDRTRIDKYKRSEQVRLSGVKTDFFKEKFKKRKEHLILNQKQAARAEILNTNEDVGFIEPDEGYSTYTVSQKEIVDAVDITSASKHFQLDLPKFGPYRIDYTRNGRHLALAGKRGHVAAFDNLTKQLHCETNVMESVRDVKFLHNETMFAVAQRKWTFVYDSTGTELHCLKALNDVRRLEFLPYHFLLVAATGTSYLHWLDVSIGTLIQSTPTREGQLDVLCQNPANAIVHCGHAKGTVSLWSPNVKEPLVKMLCHRGPVRGVAVDDTGYYMVTSGMDRQLRVWDIRQYKQLKNYKLPCELAEVAISQKKVVACAMGTKVQIFKDLCTRDVDAPYLVHDCQSTVTDLRFCPYEDVLGVGHQQGFVSLLVPGAGEANVDALEANPYQSKKQRNEQEVKQLLDKIQPEMISLSSSDIADVDTAALEESLMDRAAILYLKPQRIDFQPRHKMKGKGSSLKRAQRKSGVLEKDRLQKSLDRSRMRDSLLDTDEQEDDTDQKPPPAKSALDRFKRKDR